MGANIHFQLAYDATPKKVAFGKLADQLQGIARYPWWTGQRWEMLKASEFARKTRTVKHRLFHGVVDVLASHLEVSYLDGSDLLRGFFVLGLNDDENIT